LQWNKHRVNAVLGEEHLDESCNFILITRRINALNLDKPLKQFYSFLLCFPIDG